MLELCQCLIQVPSNLDLEQMGWNSLWLPDPECIEIQSLELGSNLISQHPSQLLDQIHQRFPRLAFQI